MTSLALLIAGYKAGRADYDQNVPAGLEAADAYANIAFVPHLQAIRAFDGATQSLGETLLALETAEDELADGDIDTAKALVSAAKLYLREVCVG